MAEHAELLTPHAPHAPPPRAEHFASLEVQAHAARFGMWVFLASEALLFAGLFMLYAGYRAHDPATFGEHIHHSEKILGTANTCVLLVSSTLVACGLHMLRTAKARASALLLLGASALGAAFLAIKLTEYSHHLAAGEHPGKEPFWTLYFLMTGLHAIHVTVGMAALLAMAARVLRGTVNAAYAHPLENACVYWHLVDAVWIVLWPLFYLA